MDDRAGKFHIQQNLLMINADFRVFVDMVERWVHAYSHVPGCRGTVKEVVHEWFEQQLGARDRAAACLERLRAAAPGDPQALSGLRRLHRATERWQQLNEVCAEMARRPAEPAERLELWREAAAVAESKLGDPARAAEAWRQVAELDPADAGALVARSDSTSGWTARPYTTK